MALSAVAGCRERLASGVMTCTAGSLGCFSRLVHPRLIIQRSSAGLRPQLVVAEFAVVAGTLDVLGVIESHIPEFRCERQFCRRSLLLLCQRGKAAGDKAGKDQRN